jgi:hypothetical protein
MQYTATVVDGDYNVAYAMLVVLILHVATGTTVG